MCEWCGDSIPCCSCMSMWPESHEKAAQRFIQLNSRKASLGLILGRLPGCCYNRHCIQKYHCFFIMLTLIAVGVIIWATVVFNRESFLESLKSTDCKIVSMNTNKTTDCEARHDESYKWVEYSCLQVFVVYEELTAERGPEARALLYKDYPTVTSTYRGQCSARLSVCPWEDENVEPASKVNEKYYERMINETFKCGYNPDNLYQVLENYDRWIGKEGALKIQLGLVFFALFCAFMNIVLLCTCGCAYICSTNVPVEIQQEVDRHQMTERPQNVQRSGEAGTQTTQTEQDRENLPLTADLVDPPPPYDAQVPTAPPDPRIPPMAYLPPYEEQNECNKSKEAFTQA